MQSSRTSSISTRSKEVWSASTSSSDQPTPITWVLSLQPMYGYCRSKTKDELITLVLSAIYEPYKLPQEMTPLLLQIKISYRRVTPYEIDVIFPLVFIKDFVY